MTNVTAEKIIPNPKKLSFSISVQSNNDGQDKKKSVNTSSSEANKSNLIESIFPTKKKPKLNTFFSWSSSKANNSSLESSSATIATTASVSPKLMQPMAVSDSDSVKSAPVYCASTQPFFQQSQPVAEQTTAAAGGSSFVYSKAEIYEQPAETYSPSVIRYFEIFKYSKSNSIINLALMKRSSLKTLCEDMRRQILSRAFYGWLAYHRQIKTINLHLVGLINCERNCIQEEELDDDDEEEDEDASVEPQTIEQDLELIERLLNNTETTSVETISQKNLNRICEWYLTNKKKLDTRLWNRLSDEKNGKTRLVKNKNIFYKIVYYNGIENKLRKEVNFTIKNSIFIRFNNSLELANVSTVSLIDGLFIGL